MTIDIKYWGKQYDLLYVDPPWSYENENTGGNNTSGALNKYNTISTEDIASMPIWRLCEKNCCLFMWAVTPLLPDAFYVMKKWGFEYKTTVYWRKKGRLGMGFWFRGDIEPCIIGIKGEVPAFGLQVSNFLDIPPREHSRKPDEMYSLIESIGFKRKLEIFAREKREGWDVWGNQIPNTMQRTLERF